MQPRIRDEASICLLNQNNDVLVIRSKKDGRFCLPGGGVDPGEESHQAASRELEEETGIRHHFNSDDFRTIYARPEGSTIYLFRGVVNGDDTLPEPSSQEADQIIWMSAQQIAQNKQDFRPHHLRRIRHGIPLHEHIMLLPETSKTQSSLAASKDLTTAHAR